MADKLSDLRKRFWKKKGCESSTASNWTEEMASKNPPGKWLKYLEQTKFFFWCRDSLPFSIHCIENHTQKRIFYSAKFLQW